MRNKKCWKRLLAFALTGVMLFPASSVHAEEGQMMEESEGQEEVYAGGEEASGDGFQIENGMLVKYTGSDTEVVIPNGVVRIDSYAFEDCDKLTSITIPESVHVIEESAFPGCVKLTEIKVDERNQYYKAYDGCLYDRAGTTLIQCPEGKTEASILSGVTRIGDRAFGDCSSLANITIPESVTEIGENAFYYCDSLADITIPESVTKIGLSAFAYCGSLTEITVPKNVAEIGEGAFRGCDELTEIKVDAGNQYYKAYDGCLYDKAGTTLIQCPAGKTEVSILSGVTQIGQCAFERCGMTGITIPESVTRIGKSAFYSCTSLRSVTILSGVTEIGDDAFRYCENLRAVSIPESVTRIGTGYDDDDNEVGSNIFIGCKDVTIYGKANSYAQTYAQRFHIPFSTEAMPEVKDISECEITLSQTSYEYDGQEKTPEVTVKDNGKTLTEGVDYTVEYEDNVEAGTACAVITGKGAYIYSEYVYFTITSEEFQIENGVLIKYTGNVEHVVIPDTVREIKSSAFSGNNYIKSVTIPSNVEKIGNLAFSLCNSMTVITVAEDNSTFSSVDGCLYNKDKTTLLLCPTGKTELNIPAGVKEVGEWACTFGNLERVTIPNGVIKIGTHAFSSQSHLGGVVIPASVTEIGTQAFTGYGGLTIYGESGSYAETYAKNNHILFSAESMPEPKAPGKLSDCEIIWVQWADSYIYDGGEKEPAVIIKNGTHILRKDTDYTVEYQNNLNVGTATVTLTGAGDYTGTVTKNFTIKNGEPIKLSNGTGNKNLHRIFVWDIIYDSNGNVVDKEKRTEWGFKCDSGSYLAADGSHYRFEADESLLNSNKKLLHPEKKIQEGVVSGSDIMVTFEYVADTGFWGHVHGAGAYGSSICYDLYARTEEGTPIDEISIYKEGYFDGDEEWDFVYMDECRFASDGTYEVIGNGMEEGVYYNWIENSTVNGYTKLMVQKEKEDGTVVQYIPRDYMIGDLNIIDDNGQDGTDKYGNKLRKIYGSGAYERYDTGEKFDNYKVSILDADGNKIGDVIVDVPKEDGWRASPEVNLTYRVENLASGWKLTASFSKTNDFFEHPVTGEKIALLRPNALVSITATKLSGNNQSGGNTVIKPPQDQTGTQNQQMQSISCTKEYNKKYGDKSFTLDVKVTKGDGKLTYTSSDKNVAVVDENSGKVTIKGCGVATITVKAGATTNYKETTAQILIKVTPAKLKALSLKVKSGRKLKVSWKKDKTATGYEIQYSTDKKFKNKKATKTITVKKNKTVSKTISKLTKNKRYYVRVRAYKNAKINGKTQKLSGTWSGVKRSGKI